MKTLARHRGIGGHQRPHRGRTDVWLTPPDIVNVLGPFDLDPCAAPEPRPWSTAKKHLTEKGLEEPWAGRVWLNPPYGPETGRWLANLADHGNGIALAFARTETEMFHVWVWPHADAVLFLHGRLHFHHPDGRRAVHNAGGPSVLIAYGAENARRLEEAGFDGRFLRLKENAE